MTDQDNLRDRIADLLWRTEEKSWEDQAQAIIDQLRTDETVARLANFLHNDDVGETLNEHEESCRIPDCNERDLYAEYALAAINALLGEH